MDVKNFKKLTRETAFKIVKKSGVFLTKQAIHFSIDGNMKRLEAIVIAQEKSIQEIDVIPILVKASVKKQIEKNKKKALVKKNQLWYLIRITKL